MAGVMVPAATEDRQFWISTEKYYLSPNFVLGSFF